jgi:manganese-dependent ADP-ribose/CDP-alcohol diphosphatase
MKVWLVHLIFFCLGVARIVAFGMPSFAPADAPPGCRRRSTRLKSKRREHKAPWETPSRPSKRSSSNSSQVPLLRVGLLADIQYAPVPDGASYGGSPRYYQNALRVAHAAAQAFHAAELPYVLQLGDILDGKCQAIALHGGLARSETNGVTVGEQCLSHVLGALSAYGCGRILHTHGNHCLYNLDRPTLAAQLGIPFRREGEEGDGSRRSKPVPPPIADDNEPDDLVGYYSVFDESSGVRFVVLDCYDHCKLRPKTSAKYQAAVALLKANNPNYGSNENSPEGLEGVDRRFVAFNGGLGDTQLAWLRTTLQAARAAHERVVVVSHLPLLPASSHPVCLVWNYEAVLAILRDYADVVAISLAGHAHKGGYGRDETSGIHFRVVEAVLESLAPTYGVLEVFSDFVRIVGTGDCVSADYDLDHLAVAAAESC